MIRVITRWLTLLATACASAVWGQTSPVVISQIYGGGGNSGAPLQADFIELFNRGSQAVDLTGWTVQYASASGVTWERTTLSGSVQPGQYYLVQENQGSVGASLSTPDVMGGINLSASAGKVAVVTTNDLLSGSAPTGPQIIDFFGYGNANAAEGSPAPSPNNVTAILRHSNGCTDTNDNSADFVTGAPNPRSRASSVNFCSGVPRTPSISAAGIGSSASLLSGAIAPGELILIYGSGLGPSVIQGLQLTADGQTVTNSLAGTRVLIGGLASPMIFTRQDVVSAIVPYSVRSFTSVQVQEMIKAIR